MSSQATPSRPSRDLDESDKFAIKVLEQTIKMIKTIGWPQNAFIIQGDPREEKSFFICLARNMGGRVTTAIRDP